MASNDNNGKHKLEEEVKSLTARKGLRLSDDDTGDDDSSNSSEEEEEKVSSEETSMNDQVDTSEKLQAKRACGIAFGDDDDTTSSSSEPRTLKSHRRSNEDSSDDDDDFGCRYKSRST
jgi:hypothetical protein